MSRYTNQEIVDRTHNHFVMDMAAQCINADDMCCYWSSDHPSNRCAVGQLLTEREAFTWSEKLHMGSIHVDDLDFDQKQAVLSVFDLDQLPLLRQLQCWHDHSLKEAHTPEARQETFASAINTLKHFCPDKYGDLVAPSLDRTPTHSVPTVCEKEPEVPVAPR